MALNRDRGRGRRLLLVWLLLVALLGLGVALLLTWEIPPPSEMIEKRIPNERMGL